MKVRAIEDFTHYGKRYTGDVWEEVDKNAKQLIKKGLVEEFTHEVEAIRKVEAEAAAKADAEAKTKAKVRKNDKPADADGSQAAPES